LWKHCDIEEGEMRRMCDRCGKREWNYYAWNMRVCKQCYDELEIIVAHYLPFEAYFDRKER